MLAVMYQIYYFVTCGQRSSKILNSIMIYLYPASPSSSFRKLFFDSVINGAYVGLSVGLWGFWSTAIYVAAVTYKKEYPDEEYNI
jgi:hypothetical protein